MFKRRGTQAAQAPAEDLPAAEPDGAEAERSRPGLTPKKGAPTPKRSEAQAKRRQPYQAPANRKEATRLSRQRERVERQRKTAAQQRGEEWALPAKDKGPVRKLARDYVDARHMLGEYFLYSVVVLVILLAVRSTFTTLLLDIIVIVMIVVLVGEGWWVGRKVEALAKERFPGQSTRGVKMYVAQRGITMRRMRLPKPQVNRGDKV